MKRRDFLQLAGLAGLAVLAPPTIASTASTSATSEPFDGTFWIMVHASGGWDPTSFCDPKGYPINAFYQTKDILTANGLPHAPNRKDSLNGPVLDSRFEGLDRTIANPMGAVTGFTEEFYAKHASQMMVINGINTMTNGHSDGTRHTWSGALTLGMPGFAGLMAGIQAPDKPLAFITNGGYDDTAGVVSPTRFDSQGIFDRIAQPNVTYPTRGNSDYNFHSDQTSDSASGRISPFAQVQAARQARLARLVEKQNLPKVKKAMSQLELVTSGKNILTDLQVEIARLDARLNDPDDVEVQTPINNLHSQARLALAARKVGAAVSVNLVSGGFDTHGNHDNNHLNSLSTLLRGVDAIMDEIKMQGLEEKVVVMVSSEFGRTPLYNKSSVETISGYNSGNGKDHWSVTSMLLLGHGIPAGRLVGATDDEFRVKKINPQTLEVDPDGIEITAAHIHKALRKFSGFGDHTLMTKYSLDGEDLPLFDP